MGDILHHYATRGIAWFLGLALAVSAAWYAAASRLVDVDLSVLRLSLVLLCIVLGTALWVFTESRVGFVFGAAFLSILSLEALAAFPELTGLP